MRRPPGKPSVTYLFLASVLIKQSNTHTKSQQTRPKGQDFSIELNRDLSYLRRTRSAVINLVYYCFDIRSSESVTCRLLLLSTRSRRGEDRRRTRRGFITTNFIRVQQMDNNNPRLFHAAATTALVCHDGTDRGWRIVEEGGART